MMSEQPVETVQEGIRVDAPPVMTCMGCGGVFSLWVWQPRLRCPHCGMLGSPDRAMRNLLPLGWECPVCGASNDASTNFCVACGAGLASRCLRCEAPVYGAVCLNCGAHQARWLRLQTAQERRATWEPIQRDRIREQRIQEQVAQLRASPPLPEAQVGSPLPSRQAASKHHRPSRGRVIWGLMMVAMGVYLLDRQGIPIFSTLQTAAQNIGLSAWAAGAWEQVQGWWAAFYPTLDGLARLSPADTRYAYLFMSVVIGMAAMPFLLYMIVRLAHRMFP